MSEDFNSLLSKVGEWTPDDEDILLRKIQNFSDYYCRRVQETKENLIKIDNHIEKVEFDYYNAINYMKNLSIKRFIEHVIEEEDPNAIASRSQENSNTRQPKPIITKEDREKNLLLKFRSSISTSLENLHIRNLIDLNRDNPELNESLIDNDNISVISSKILNPKKNTKLPYIIGTHEFFKNEFLGIFNEDLMNISFTSRRKQELDTNFLKNDLIENEIFTENNIVKPAEEIPDLTKLNQANSPIEKQNLVPPVTDQIFNQNNQPVLDNIIMKENRNEIDDVFNKPSIESNNKINDAVPYKKPLNNDATIPLGNNTISLNNFVKSSLFDNTEEEDTLFKTKIKPNIIPEEKINSKPENVAQIIPPTKSNLFSIVETEEKPEEKEKPEKTIQNKVIFEEKPKEPKKQNLFAEKEESNEIDEVKRISSMKKKLNRFLTEFEEEDNLDIVPSVKPVAPSTVEKKVEQEKQVTNPQSSHPESLFSSATKPDIVQPVSNSKKSLPFKSSFLYDEEEEFDPRPKKGIKEKMKEEVSTSQNNLIDLNPPRDTTSLPQSNNSVKNMFPDLWTIDFTTNEKAEPKTETPAILTDKFPNQTIPPIKDEFKPEIVDILPIQTPKAQLDIPEDNIIKQENKVIQDETKPQDPKEKLNEIIKNIQSGASTSISKGPSAKKDIKINFLEENEDPLTIPANKPKPAPIKVNKPVSKPKPRLFGEEIEEEEDDLFTKNLKKNQRIIQLAPAVIPQPKQQENSIVNNQPLEVDSRNNELNEYEDVIAKKVVTKGMKKKPTLKSLGQENKKIDVAQAVREIITFPSLPKDPKIEDSPIHNQENSHDHEKPILPMTITVENQLSKVEHLSTQPSSIPHNTFEDIEEKPKNTDINRKDEPPNDILKVNIKNKYESEATQELFTSKTSEKDEEIVKKEKDEEIVKKEKEEEIVKTEKEEDILKKEKEEEIVKTEKEEEILKKEKEYQQTNQINQVGVESTVDAIKEIQTKIFSNIKLQDEVKKAPPKKISIAFDDDD